MRSGTRCRAMKGWLAACGTATAAIYIVVLLAFEAGRIKSIGEGIASFVVFVPLILIVTCLLTAIPAALVIWLSERFQIRSVWFFGCAGGVLGALGQTILYQSFYFAFAAPFILAGFLAGLTYWQVAARPAGGAPA
jgi:hypothetical protein